MMRLTYKEVIDWTGAVGYGVEQTRPVASVTIDSRVVEPGTLFVALPGSRTHGHQFVPEVWRRQGVALVEPQFPLYDGPRLTVPSPLDALGELMRRYIVEHGVTVVGVTGSVGKTSTKELCHAVLSTTFACASSIKNYNTAIGLPLSFFQAPAGTTHFVAEMGMSAAGEIRRLTQLAPPQVAVITTIGSSHLEKLGSMEAIQAAKGEILENLSPTGTAVLNADNPWVRALGERLPRGRVLWFGRDPGADAQILQAHLGIAHTTHVTLGVEGRQVTLRLPWLGVHHAFNVAAAVLVGRTLGVSWEHIEAGIAAVPVSSSRIQQYPVGTLTIVEDAYNSSPVSMKAALEVLAAQPGRRVAVLGDMFELGAEEETGHREVGSYCAGRADWLVGVGTRARWIVEAARAQGVPCQWAATLDEALTVLKTGLQAGDTVLLKASRGMALERLAERLKEWGGPR